MDVDGDDAGAAAAASGDPVLAAMRERGLLGQYRRLFDDPTLAGGEGPARARALHEGFAHVTEAALAAQASAAAG